MVKRAISSPIKEIQQQSIHSYQKNLGEVLRLQLSEILAQRKHYYYFSLFYIFSLLLPTSTILFLHFDSSFE